MKIDLVTDVVCPWCYIGTERLVKVLDGLGVADQVEVEHHPFLLQPDVPEVGASLTDFLSRKYGADPKAMFVRPEAAARESGIPLDFSRVPRIFPTVRAHTLLRQAEAVLPLARALYRAYFVDGENIADVDLLVRVGAAHGLEAEETRRALTDPSELARTRAEADGSRASGVSGVPFYVLGGKFAVSGAQPEQVLRDAVLRAMS